MLSLLNRGSSSIHVLANSWQVLTYVEILMVFLLSWNFESRTYVKGLGYCEGLVFRSFQLYVPLILIIIWNKTKAFNAVYAVS